MILFIILVIPLLIWCILNVFQNTSNNRPKNTKMSSDEVIEDLIMCDMLGIFK